MSSRLNAEALCQVYVPVLVVYLVGSASFEFSKDFYPSIPLISERFNLIASNMWYDTTGRVTLPCGVSGPRSVSAGNAGFIVIALIFGCMTQPPGSLITMNCNRFWRISPFHAMTEGITIFLRLSIPLFHYGATAVRRRLSVDNDWYLGPREKQGTYGFRVAAHAMLAERLGNSRQYNLWQKQQFKLAAPTVEDMVALLDEVGKMERGSTLRPVVIVPMVLQFLKICFIKGSYLRVLPLAYFISWVAVESLLLLVHGDKLDDEEKFSAETVLLLSVSPPEVPLPRKRRDARPDEGVDPSTDDSGLLGASEVVVSQNAALLEQFASPERLPSHQVLFRSGRVRLSLEGSPSMHFVQSILGSMALAFESLSQNCYTIYLLRHAVPRWMFWLAIVALMLMLPTFLDMRIGDYIAKVSMDMRPGRRDHWSGGFRDLVVSKTLIIEMVYFIFLYKASGAIKPTWLDWLG